MSVNRGWQSSKNRDLGKEPAEETKVGNKNRKVVESWKPVKNMFRVEGVAASLPSAASTSGKMSLIGALDKSSLCGMVEAET